MPACVTPGIARTRSSTRSKKTLALRRHEVHVLRRLVEVLACRPSRMSAVSSRSRVEAGQRCSARAGSPASSGRRRRAAPSTSADLGHEQRARPAAARAAPPRPPSFSTSLRSTREARSAGTRPKTQARDDRDGEREARARAASTWMWRSSSGKPAGTISGEEARAPEGEDQAERAARRARAAGSRSSSCRISRPRPAPGRGAQRQLLLPRGSRRQQQVGHVRARDQQHEADARRAGSVRPLRAPPK